MTSALAYLLDLRVKVRGSPEATRIVDRCLRLLALAEAGQVPAAVLDAELDALRADLEQRFGPRPKITAH